MKKIDSSARKISFMGILLALNTIILYLVRIIHTNTIGLLSISSLFVSIVVVELGIKESIIYFFGTIILGFFAIGNILHFLMYALFFSNFGIIKALIESKIHTEFKKNIAKTLYSFLIMIFSYFIFKNFISDNISAGYFLLIIVIIYIYDYMYSMAVRYYIDHIRKRIGRE